MKKLFAIITAFVCSLSLSAQSSDEGRVSIKAMMPDGIVPDEAARNMETRMQRLLTSNGYADNDYAVRFVLTAKIDVTSKDVVPSTPARVSEKMDITFMVGDVVENKIYATSTVSVAGIGTTENKAMISAFTKVNPNTPALKEMLEEAKSKIVDFYTNNCSAEISRAKTMASTGNYDEAIARMMAVPDVCSTCYQECLSTATSIYQQKIDALSLQQLNKARNAWLENPNAKGAAAVADCLDEISPNSTYYADAEKLRQQVTNKLKADEQREWNFRMKQYNDRQAMLKRQYEDNKAYRNKQQEYNQTFKLSIVSACRDVGVAWASHQPKSIVKNIVRGWM